MPYTLVPNASTLMPILPVTINIGSQLGSDFFRIKSVGSLISGILAAALTLGSLAFILYFIFGALRWLTAGGDKAQIESARSRITNAFIGLVLLAAAWAIYLLVIYVLGLGGAIITSGSGTPSGPSGTPSGPSGTPSGTVCIYPTRRCCDDINDSTCFCQNINYQAVSHGSCDAGGGYTGVLCSCEPV